MDLVALVLDLVAQKIDLLSLAWKRVSKDLCEILRQENLTNHEYFGISLVLYVFSYGLCITREIV